MNINPSIAGPAETDFVEEGGGFDFSLRQVWAAAYRNRLVLIAAMALCIIASILYMLLATPVFEAAASVQIEQQAQRILKDDQRSVATSPLETEQFLRTQIDIIKSRSVALAVARNQHLVGNPDFLRRMHLKPVLANSPLLKPREAQEKQAVAILLGGLKADVPTDSRIVKISFRSPDPQLAAQVANSFADAYISSDLARKFGASAYARQFISQQLGDAKQQLERAERAALDYASRERLIDVSNGADSAAGATSAPKSLTVARLVALNNVYADAVAKRTQAEQKWRQAQGAAIMTLPEVLSNPTVQNLLQRRAVAQAEYQDQRQTRKEDFPTVRQAKAQLDELNRQLGLVSASIRSSLQSQYDAAARQEEALRTQIGGLEQSTLGEQQREVQLSILRRATDTSRALYDTLLQRFRELNAEAGAQPNNIQIIDRADIPTAPVSPKLLIVLGLGILSGIVLGMAAVFVLEHLNDTVRSAEDVAGKLDMPVLGSVPVVRAKEVEPELQDLKSPISEAYSSVRAALMMSSREGLPATLSLTSIQPGEGKTTSGFAIATGLARIGKQVVVIDCDLRRPAVHKAFGVRNGRGMSDYLSGQATVDSIVQPSGQPDVSVVTCGPIPPNPTELLSGPLLTGLIGELSRRFDVVIVDAPPILGLADAVVIGAQVGGTVLVLEAGRNYRGSLRASVARLRRGGARVLGAVITKQNLRDLGYAYQEGYYQYGD